MTAAPGRLRLVVTFVALLALTTSDHRLPALALRTPSGSRIEFHGADEPKVLRRANGAYDDAAFGDIRVGDTVEVWALPGNNQPRAAAAVVFTRGG